MKPGYPAPELGARFAGSAFMAAHQCPRLRTSRTLYLLMGLLSPGLRGVELVVERQRE
jgi:hypothetical protein